jgi:hypothetical protein
MAQPHESPGAHEAPAAPTQHHTIEEAAHLLLAGLNQMKPRLSHGYGCPSEHAGPCTCGYAEVVSGTEELVDALEAAQPAPEGTRKR